MTSISAVELAATWQLNVFAGDSGAAGRLQSPCAASFGRFENDGRHVWDGMRMCLAVPSI